MSVQLEPTKANLIRLKEELRFAQEGHEILDRKREILLKEMTDLIARHNKLRGELTALLVPAYKKHSSVMNELGPSLVEYVSLTRKGLVEISIKYVSLMGVKIPRLQTLKSEIPYHSPGHDPEGLDGLIDDVRKIFIVLLQYTETLSSLKKVAFEVLRTQKRIRALENIHIPGYREGISYIYSSLEENERDELIRYKKLKRKK